MHFSWEMLGGGIGCFFVFIVIVLVVLIVVFLFPSSVRYICMNTYGFGRTNNTHNLANILKDIIYGKNKVGE